MNTQLIAITRADGPLAIMHFVLSQPPCDAGPGWSREATPENVEAEIAKAGITDVVSWRFIKPEDLPPTCEHRSSWRDNGSRIVAGS